METSEIQKTYASRRRGMVLLPFSLAMAVFLWYIIIWIGDLRAFILPTPDLVWMRFINTLEDGSLTRNFLVTLGEVVSGLLIGSSLAVAFGYTLAKSRPLEQFLSPYIVASQSVPVVAIAPLLVIWFGPGLTSKVLICALIVFFPMLINTIVGVRAVPKDLLDLMRSLQATRWQTFKLLEVPAAMPVLFGGLRIGATLAVIGAVVGELVGSDRGLGFLINVGRGQYDTALVFVSVFSLVAMALVLYGLVVLIENKFLSWQVCPEQDLLKA
ncbi:MAG: ABC transporter permease [Anaerolineales bacterium]|jgi:NitT/TauT family transport system permease protein